MWGNLEVPPQSRRRGLVGETWFPPRERAEGERRSFELTEPVVRPQPELTLQPWKLLEQRTSAAGSSTRARTSRRATTVAILDLA